MTFSDNTNGGENSAKTKVLSSLKSTKGVLLSFLSAIFTSFSGEFTALASKDGIPSFQIFLLMRLIEILALLPFLVFCRPAKLTGENKHQNIMIVLFVIVGNLATIALFLSFVYTVPGIAFGIIQGSMPFFVACIGFLFLKEHVSLFDGCAILISVTGVVLMVVGMTNITAMSTTLLVLSIVIPLLASFVFAPDAIIRRHMAAKLGLPIVTALLHQSIFGAVAFLAISYALETPVWTMAWSTALYVVGLGVSWFIAGYGILAASTEDKAYIVAAIRMLTIPITILLDYLFLQKVPNSLQVTGLILVMLGTLLVSVYTWWAHRREEMQRELLETLRFDPDQG